MYKFFIDYFNFSHEESYSILRGNPIKVSKKNRKISLIICYIVILFSFFIFFSPLNWIQNLYLWFAIIIYPVSIIFIFDFRVFKILRLYRYSKSKNINKKIIYSGYMINDFRNLFIKIFMNLSKKRIDIDNSSFRYRINCYWKINKLIIIVKTNKIIIKINKNKLIIRNNKDDFDVILRKINNKLINEYHF